MTTPPTPEYVTLREIAALVRVTTRTVVAWVERGEFPAPLRLGGRRARTGRCVQRWRRETVLAWLASREAAHA